MVCNDTGAINTHDIKESYNLHHLHTYARLSHTHPKPGTTHFLNLMTRNPVEGSIHVTPDGPNHISVRKSLIREGHQRYVVGHPWNEPREGSRTSRCEV